MGRTMRITAAALVFLWAALPALRAEEGEEAPVENPKYVGVPVEEPSGLENLLATQYNKRQTEHFFLETSYPVEAAKDYIAFCEKQYEAFLAWAGLPKDHKLWGQRARIAIIGNKGEWEALQAYRNRNLPQREIEMRKKVGGTWSSSPPYVHNYSREGSTADHDKLHLYHSLTHLFQHGLSGSSREGFIPWLYEAFSFYRALELFGATGSGCINFDTQAEQAKTRAWNDPDDWIKLLKREVRKKNDEDFVLFWHKDLSSIPKPTYVKAWSLIDYFLRDEEAKADFIRFLKMLKTKNDQAKALKMIYNATPDDIDKEWRKWIKRQRSRKLTKGRKKR